MSVTPEMRRELYKWTDRVSRWKPHCVGHRWDIGADFCCAVVWHRLGVDVVQTIELHICDDLAVCAFVHPPEPLSEMVADMLRGAE